MPPPRDECASKYPFLKPLKVFPGLCIFGRHFHGYFAAESGSITLYYSTQCG
jgi:hypothetical protein